MIAEGRRLLIGAAARVTVAAALAVAAGCAVGPDYSRPEVSVPVGFRGETGPREGDSLADLPWWEVFEDPALQGLVREALAGNYDLRIAVARVEQARALAGVARAELFPWVNYQVGVQRDRGVFKFVPELERPEGGTDNLFIGGLAATWEVDVWGRILRLNEAARAELFATEEGRRAVLLTLVSDVAQAYFELLALDLRLAIARSARDSFDRTYTIFRRRFEQGVVSTLQTSRAEGALASAAASIPDLERQIAIKENQINVLLGRDPAAVPRGAALTAQRMPPAVPPGLPSALLERRPDIRQAEQRLVKANAQIGVAKADFFPRVGLTALLGGVSPELSAITSGTASVWALAGALSGPIFQGGWQSWQPAVLTMYLPRATRCCRRSFCNWAGDGSGLTSHANPLLCPRRIGRTQTSHGAGIVLTRAHVLALLLIAHAIRWGPF
jgi:multidrug efflux system outer membrane protein